MIAPTVVVPLKQRRVMEDATSGGFEILAGALRA
jgi:hypothetical protein